MNFETGIKKENLTKLKPGQLNKLNIEIKSSNLKKNNKKGIF